MLSFPVAILSTHSRVFLCRFRSDVTFGSNLYSVLPLDSKPEDVFNSRTASSRLSQPPSTPPSAQPPTAHLQAFPLARTPSDITYSAGAREGSPLSNTSLSDSEVPAQSSSPTSSDAGQLYKQAAYYKKYLKR